MERLHAWRLLEPGTTWGCRWSEWHRLLLLHATLLRPTGDLKDDQPELGAEGGLPYGCGHRGSSLAGLEAELVEFSGCLSREVTLVCLARGGGKRKLTGNGCKAGRLID